VHKVGLDEIARFVQLGEVGAAPREKVHVTVLDTSQQQVVRRAAGALQVGKEKVQASTHEAPPSTLRLYRVALQR
jgi:hypothetical protein